MPDRLGPAATGLPRAARAVAREVLVHGPQSRTDLARKLELSAGSLTRLTRPLIDSGLLVEGAAQRGAGRGQGRPSLPLDIAAAEHHFVGVKLTARHLYAVLTDLRARVLADLHVDLVRYDPADVCDVIAATVDDLTRDRSALRAVGVTIGGHTADRSTIVSAPYLGWREVDLSGLLTERTGLPTAVDNDVVALTEAQHWFGAGRGLERFAVVTIGAGVGYALVVHDKVVRGADIDLGVLGDHRLDDCGPLTADGRRGTVSSYLASGSISASAAAALGRPVTYEEVVRLADEGDAACRRVVDEAGRALGRLVASVANFAMTERIILSGEGIALARSARAAVLQGVSESRPAWARPLVLDVNPMDFSEWARGAAVVAIQTFMLGPD